MRRRLLRASVALASLALAVPFAANAASTAPTKMHATTVKVTAGKPTEFHFVLSKKSVPAGAVTFTIVNKGQLAHDFKIAGKTSKMVQPGKSTKLKVTLKKGKSTYLCTVPGHAAAGMKGKLTVK
jgi:uncharacterized cupredoxin-like copper-binding protein